MTISPQSSKTNGSNNTNPETEAKLALPETEAKLALPETEARLPYRALRLRLDCRTGP